VNGLIRARAREKLATIEAVEEAILLTAPYVASSQTKNQAAITASTQALRDTTGNLPPMPGIFPDYMTPIVRNAPDGDRIGRRGLEAATPPASPTCSRSSPRAARRMARHEREANGNHRQGHGLGRALIMLVAFALAMWPTITPAR